MDGKRLRDDHDRGMWQTRRGLGKIGGIVAAVSKGSLVAMTGAMNFAAATGAGSHWLVYGFDIAPESQPVAESLRFSCFPVS
jgi:hypothetical protein